MQKKSFTLVELMIVIAILAILSAIVIFALNPARLFDNFRDSKRVTDISSINKAIVFMESWNQSGITYGTTTNVYISLPDSNPSCTSYTLPTLPTGFTYYCSNATSYKNTDGTGWIPINFTVEGSNRYLSSLPVDPVNNSSFFYTYYPGGSYELTAILSNPNKNSINDEGSLTSTFEIGSPNRTFVTPLQRDKGLVGYWKFNEGSGNYVYDYSGYGNNGTWYGTGTRYLIMNNDEKAGNFNGTSDRVIIPNSASLSNKEYFTMTAWVNPNLLTGVSVRNITIKGAYKWGTALSLSSDGKIHIEMGVLPEACAGISGTGIVPLNQWTMVAFSYDRVKQRTYLNGAVDRQVSETRQLVQNNDIMAFSYWGSYWWSGYMDNIRLYNRALADGEITQIYNIEKYQYGL